MIARTIDIRGRAATTLIRIALACGVVLMAPIGARPAAAQSAVWQRGTGTSELKGNLTDEQARLEAQQRARADAIEKAMGQLVSYKFVNLGSKRDKSKSSFVYRELSALAQGVIIGAKNEQFALSPVYSTNREVLFMQYVCTGDYHVAPPPAPDPAFSLDIALSRDAYSAGERLTFEVKSNKPAHLLVFNLAADDRVYLLYPNRFVPDLTLKPGAPLRLPRASDGIRLRLATMPGHTVDAESMRVIATRELTNPPKVGADGSVPLIDFMRWLYGLPPGEWSEAEQTYTITTTNR